MNETKKPIINCHTHIFTNRHVPPHLAKTILPEPIYRLVNFTFVFKIFHWWYSDKGPAKRPQQPAYKRAARKRYQIKMFLARNYILGPLSKLLGLFLLVSVFYILWNWMSGLVKPGNSVIAKYINQFHDWLSGHHLLLSFSNNWLNLALAIVFMIFFKSGRNFIFFIFKKAWQFLGSLPGKETKEVFKRYLTIGRFAFQKGQGTILGELERQYPDGTGFIILPMDMEYMEAGKVKESYRLQMDALGKLKEAQGNLIFPFVFADPRRMVAEPDYFKFSPGDGTITLDDCFIKKFIKEKKFSGFKIYPALGYYPFDELLLPLWKYAADNAIPIITHCVRGPMYYRGTKKKEWDNHPVFKQAMGNGNYEELLLPETKNSEFTANFTHPLNFLCLLKEQFLRSWIHKIIAKNPESPLRQIFGYTSSEEPLKHNLHHLKICLGHFGGGDEWKRFFEQDRYGFSNELSQNPAFGIDFLLTKQAAPSPGKPELLWKYTDWYSIICSMMLQHPNIYADISYILHSDAEILPLLKQTLQNPVLRKKVLYGTDFYVVRNHKSDKNMLADMMGGLAMEDFDTIVRENTHTFLNLA